MRRFFLIFTFLCTISSISLAQGKDRLEVADELRASGQWGAAAAMYERVLWDNPEPSLMVKVLMNKADCYAFDGRFDEAVQTLFRSPMFGISEEDRMLLTYKKLCFHYLSGDMDVFEKYLDEAMQLGSISGADILSIRKVLEGTSPRHRSEILAQLLSVIPGAGHFYAGEPLPGLGYLLSESYIIAGAIWAVASQLYITGIVGGAMSLAPQATSAAAGAMGAVEKFNRKEKIRYYLPVYGVLSARGR